MCGPLIFSGHRNKFHRVAQVCQPLDDAGITDHMACAHHQKPRVGSLLLQVILSIGDHARVPVRKQLAVQLILTVEDGFLIIGLGKPLGIPGLPLLHPFTQQSGLFVQRLLHFRIQRLLAQNIGQSGLGRCV